MLSLLKLIDIGSLSSVIELKLSLDRYTWVRWSRNKNNGNLLVRLNVTSSSFLVFGDHWSWLLEINFPINEIKWKVKILSLEFNSIFVHNLRRNHGIANIFTFFRITFFLSHQTQSSDFPALASRLENQWCGSTTSLKRQVALEEKPQIALHNYS